MKRLMKKLSIITCATMIVGTGISGMAIAANSNQPQAEREMPLLPPMIERLADKLDLTEAQQAELKSLKERQQALRSEFWEVFTEDQKTTMLQAMMKHRKDRGGDKHFRKGHHKGERGDRGERPEGPNPSR
ncbi:hypothetical protein ACFOEW_20850 [Alteromonas oceani]|uniref:Zinc resistance-associated protein n=1 Tax=Alteromonas oceani TaxID=2071609 RepID=A0ABV7K7E8_9ALTE|nr:hypothetical protein [Alteromonas oceani]